MKKLITIIILALLIATAGAEETVYRKMTAEELIREFEIDATQANSKYANKLIEIYGIPDKSNLGFFEQTVEFRYDSDYIVIAKFEQLSKEQGEIVKSPFTIRSTEGQIYVDYFPISIKGEYDFVNEHKEITYIFIKNAILID